MNNIAENINIIKQRIQKACLSCGREADEVKLLLATKTVRPDQIRLALEAGEYLLGENKVQELRDKFASLQDIPHTNHFIGHLQTNKIKDVLRYDVSCIQSLDRLDLAEKLHRRLAETGKSIDVLIQVNTSNEESKFGIRPEYAADFVREVRQYDTLRIKGLMTIGLLSTENAAVRKCFKLLRQVQGEIVRLNLAGVEMGELSMGMSSDLETAIEEGATMVRVGTAIFGQRSTPDSYYWNESQ